MATCIKVSSFAANTLKNSFKDDCSDVKLLLGRVYGGQVDIVACASCPTQTDDAIDGIKNILSGGLSICGLSCVVTEPDVSTKDLVRKADPIMNHIAELEPFVLCCTRNGNEVSIAKVGCITANRTWTDVDWSISTERLIENSFIARAKCHIPLSFNLGQKDSWKGFLHNEIDRLCHDIVSDSTIFHLKSSQVLLGNAGCYGLPEDSTCEFLTSFITDTEDDAGTKKKKNVKLNRYLTFDVYSDLSGEHALDKAPSCSPIINYNLETVKKVNILLPVDAVSLFHSNTSVAEMVETLCQSVSKQLLAMKACICQHSKNEKFVVPVPHHYQPMDIQTLFTVVYPHGVPENELQHFRLGLQERLCLPLDRPLFRRAIKYLFPEDQENKGYLLNVHQASSLPRKSEGTQYLVMGNYTYHHYMQDRFDDNKWGCAYRSLQTLTSWFKLQGYTDRDVPNHREIQQTLVDIGDKEPNFVGSRKWIGSMEVSFVLDTLLGVTSKILSVSSGAELASKGRELASHFSSQGTPVMIGGGVLAHTILGVDYNEVTGDINYLILDPHYTGSEDLKVIIDKGWCGWKGQDFWDQHAHYNMCMPQRPSVI